MAADCTRYTNALKFLLSNDGCFRPHSGSTVLSHLVGTYDLLFKWSLSRDTLIAGLLHNAYGSTQSEFALIRERNREQLKTKIGIKAEQLIWQFSHTSLHELCVKLLSPTSIPSYDDLQLLHIHMANFIEQQARLNQPISNERVMTLMELEPLLNLKAWSELTLVLSKVNNFELQSN